MDYYIYNEENRFTSISGSEPEHNLWTNEPINGEFIVPLFDGFEWIEGANEEEVLQAQEDVIKFKKDQCYRELFPTDWYFIRKTETGVDVPQSILDERAAIRLKYNT